MNRELLSALLDERGESDVSAALQPAAGRCCVVLGT
jgi:hypothetical protein